IPVEVTVDPLPVITAGPGAAMCAGGPGVTLTATGGSSYSWAPEAGLSATIGATVTAAPGATTVYTVTTTSISDCSYTATLTVTLNPLPLVGVSPAVFVCMGSSAVLTATGGDTYSWSPPAGLDATAGPGVNANPAGNTTYIVTGTDANGCT